MIPEHAGQELEDGPVLRVDIDREDLLYLLLTGQHEEFVLFEPQPSL